MDPSEPVTEGQRTRLRHIREGAAVWGEHGAGTAKLVRLGYVAKGTVFVACAVAITAIGTPALGGFGQIGTWWNEPVFFQKTVVWALLFEVVRSLLDVTLYLIVLTGVVWPLCMPGTVVSGITTLQPWVLAPLVGAMAVLGLRDKTIFLAARAEHYWILLLVMLFPLPGQLIGAKLVTVLVWWGAALSKLNRHFPSVVAVMMSNSPVHRWKWLRRKLFRDHPCDMRPSWLAGAHAHVGTAVEFVAPLVLLVSHGAATWVAVVVLVLFHLNIIGMFPMGVPFEWNLMMIFSAIVLFGGHPDPGFGSPISPWILAVVALSTSIVVAGNLWPHMVHSYSRCEIMRETGLRVCGVSAATLKTL